MPRDLLRGAGLVAGLLLGVPRRGAATTAVVRRPALVPEPRVLRVEVPTATHAAQTDVELLVRANHHWLVRCNRVGHGDQLLPDLHFRPPIENLHLVP